MSRVVKKLQTRRSTNVNVTVVFKHSSFCPLKNIKKNILTHLVLKDFS